MAIYLAIIIFLSWAMSYTDIIRLKKTYFAIIILVLSVLSIFYNPIKGFLNYGIYTDLYRIFNELDLFRLYGWNLDKINNGTMDLTTNYGPIIIAKMYMFLCAKLTTNDHIISFINSIFVYGSMAIGLLLVGKKIKASDSVVVSSFVVFLIINDYSRVIANIRMPLAMAFFMLIWCKQIKNEDKKLWYYAAYVLTCLIHSAMLIFLLSKLVVDFFPNKLMKVFILIMLVSSLFSNYVIDILAHFSSMGEITRGLLQKAILYSENNNMIGISVLKDNYQVVILNLIRILFFVYLIYLLRKILYKNRNSIKINPQLVSLVYFSELITSFAIGSLWSFHLFNRTVLFMVVIMPIYLLIIAKEFNIRLLSFKNLNVFSIIAWLFVLTNVIYYFFGYTYNQLVF